MIKIMKGDETRNESDLTYPGFFFPDHRMQKGYGKNPDYPQLIGAWEGQTSQVVPISLSVTTGMVFCTSLTTNSRYLP